MARRIELNPAWLVSLLNRWALREVPGRQLGYASGSSWMRGLKSSPSSSIDPTGYSAEDYTDVEAAMKDLMENGTNLWAALMMYYKPWVIENFKAEGYPFQSSTYYERLHRGHAEVAATMERWRAARRKVTQIQRFPLDTTAEVGI